MENSLSFSTENDEESMADGDNIALQPTFPNTYDVFMKKHLQHYGYYTGQNATIRENFRNLQEWKKNYDHRLSGQHDLSLMEEHFGRPGSFPAKLIDIPSVFSNDGIISDELLHRTTQLVFHYQAGRKIPKLREPRNLYALTKEAGPQQATRWPSHLQVVCPSIRFIDYNPNIPDPLYEPTGREPTPAVRGSQIGEMIYYNDPGRDLYFMRSRVAGCRLAMRTTPPPREYPEDNLTLEFESRFESGNLLKVDKITDFEYELTLRTDLYTTKHTQWFFFRVRNMRPDKTYRFTIINLMKPSSLYNQGMKPVWYSEINAKKNKIGWIRIGSNIRYYRNNMCGRDGRSYYSLTWTCQFPYKDDCCYFAHCYPYTYSDLQEYLLQLANDPVRSRFCKQRVLTRTLAGNLVYILTITSPSRNLEISRSKRAVVITARVHPGETNASWMMKGFLDYLTSSNADAKLLRDTFIFKVVPMLNPDGVIVGNYRCSLAGRDLNRNYKSVLKDSFPSIWHTKMMIKRLNTERQVVVYCDLHGHSRKNNIFIYGCENKHNRTKRLRERVFPLMLSKNASHIFSFDSCKYKVQKSKEGTGRIVVWCMGVMNSYTMEATFGGTSLPSKRKNTHLSTKDLEMMGYHFCDTLLDYCDPDSSKVEACMRELQEIMKRKILKRLQLQNPNLTDINLDDYASDYESDTSGSDSSCDDGLPVHLLAIAPKLQRKKKLRARKERGKIATNKSATNTAVTTEKIPNNSSKAIPDKTRSLRYSQSIPNNKKKEGRQNIATDIAATDSNERHNANDKSSKKSEYLEKLTSAYLRSGVLVVSDKTKDYSLRYTNGSKGMTAQDGTFSVKYLSNLDHGPGAKSEEDTREESPLMCNVSCQWSPQPGSPASSGSEDEEALNKDAILAEEQYEILRQSALRRQLSADQQRLLAREHLAAVAAKQKRNEEKQRVSSSRSCLEITPKQSPVALEDSSRIKSPNSVLIVSQNPSQTEHQANSSQYLIAHKQGRTKSSTTDWPDTASRILHHSAKSAENQESRESDMFVTSSIAVAKEKDRHRKQLQNGELIKENDDKIPLPQQKGMISSPGEQSDSLTRKVDPSVTREHPRVNEARYFFSKVKPSTDDDRQYKTGKLSSYNDSENLGKFPSDAPLKITSSDVSKNKIQGNTELNERNSEPLNRDEQELDHSSRSRKSSINEENDRISSFMGKLSRNGVDGLLAEDSSVMAHSNLSLHNLNRPSAPRNNQQHDKKCIVKGEILFPKSNEKIVSNEITKTNSVLIEPETNTLKVQSSRSYKRSSAGNSNSELLNQRNKFKHYQSSNDSFFGMSDQVSLCVVPRNTRVPAVVANIAELRRSLLGQGRTGPDISMNKNENLRRSVGHSSSNFVKNNNEGFYSEQESIPFNKRSRKKNTTINQQFRKKESTVDLPLKQSNSAIGVFRDVHVTNSAEKHAETDEILSNCSEDDVDNASTVVTLNNSRHRSDHRRRSDNHHVTDQYTMGELDSNKNSINLRNTRGDLDKRQYTQGNITIEKQSDNSLTNVRIGSRTTDSLSANDPLFDCLSGQDYSNGGSRSETRQHTLSAVSLNVKGDEERVCVTTPALASRPVPPLLRYLSAKQGMKKK